MDYETLGNKCETNLQLFLFHCDTNLNMNQPPKNFKGINKRINKRSVK